LAAVLAENVKNRTRFYLLVEHQNGVCVALRDGVFFGDNGKCVRTLRNGALRRVAMLNFHRTFIVNVRKAYVALCYLLLEVTL